MNGSSGSGPAVGERFTLGVGETATIAGADMRVTFRELVDDSRCPPDVTCVWEGDAVVGVTIDRTAGTRQASPTTTELHTYDQLPGSADYGAYQLELVRVSDDGSRATFVVSG